MNCFKVILVRCVYAIKGVHPLLVTILKGPGSSASCEHSIRLQNDHSIGEDWCDWILALRTASMQCTRRTLSSVMNCIQKNYERRQGFEWRTGLVVPLLDR